MNSVIFGSINRNNRLFDYLHPNSGPMLLPDSTGVDTLAFDIDSLIIDSTSYIDGLDTIVLFTVDTTDIDAEIDSSLIYGKSAGGAPKGQENDYINQMKTTPFVDDINIIFGGSSKSIAHGTNGINVGGMFDYGTLPNDGTGTSQYGWDWLADLEPDVLRFPSGSFSKFIHLLHNPDGVDGAPGTESKGYGYNLEEIARYFNWTDGVLDVLNYYKIYDDVDLDWIDSKFQEEYVHFRDKCNEQQTIPNDADLTTHRYIDDFILLVNQVNSTRNTRHPGSGNVKVLICLNILSEGATECKAIVNYLRTNGVDVAGVEMGNETYGNFHCEAMGFRYFSKHSDTDADDPDNFSGNYWDYLDGKNYSGAANTGLINVLSVYMQTHHNFFGVFKNNASFICKVGICGKPLDGDYAFRLEDEEISCDPTLDQCCDKLNKWNTELRNTYTEVTTTTGWKKFDAVILHTYYAPGNWEDLVMSSDFAPQTTCTDPGTDMWNFDEPDPRLQNVMNRILGIGGTTGDGNFKDFLTKFGTTDLAYKTAFNQYNTVLNFNLSIAAGGKELWTTEWSWKDRDDAIINKYDDAMAQTKIKIFSNGLLQSYLDFEWWLQNIKLNYTTGYRNNFYTYATIQNYAGGSSELITPSDDIERAYWYKNICPYAGTCPYERNYHIKRTPYFAVSMLGAIYQNNLRYLPSTYHVHSSNVNIAPTVFVNSDKTYVYIFYSNLKGETQNYHINSGSISDLFIGHPAPDYVEFGPATVTYMKGDQLYSTAGKGNGTLLLDDINNCYDTNDHPYEIKWNQSAFNVPDCGETIIPNSCLTAPPYSIGYFMVPITPHYPTPRMASETIFCDYRLFPNPAGNFITIVDKADQRLASISKIRIYNALGVAMLETNNNLNAPINIAGLPPGAFTIEIETTVHLLVHLQFVKL